MANKYKGKTFAQIADMLQKESADRPNDPVSKQTLDDMMSRLRDAQEEYNRLKEQRRLAKAVDNMSNEEKAAIMSSLVQPMAQQEGIDLGQPMYAEGGSIHIAPSKRGTFTAAAKKHGKSVQSFASQVLANKENYSPAMVKKANFARNAKKFKHADGGHLFDIGGRKNPWEVGFLYDTGILPREIEATTVSPWDRRYITIGNNPVANINLPESVITPEDTQNINNDTTSQIKNTKKVNTKKVNFNPEYLRYAPVVGSGISALQAALQSKDFDVGNTYRQLASRLNPIAAPHIGGYRRYTPYDVNLGDTENIALTARAIDANRGQNRATQGALNAAVINAAQKTAAARNLAAQQANEANKLAVDTYNLGIDQFNAQRDTQYDQLNQEILNNRLNMLARAAVADDASKQAWAEMYNATHENFFNQLGNVGRDEWNRKAALSWMAEHPELANTDFYKLIAGKYELV